MKTAVALACDVPGVLMVSMITSTSSSAVQAHPGEQVNSGWPTHDGHVVPGSVGGLNDVAPDPSHPTRDSDLHVCSSGDSGYPL